jgi:hypothetical protein
VSTTSVAPRRFNTVDGDWRYITPESALQAVASSEESRGETVEDDQPENYVDGSIPAGPASAGADIVAVEGLRHFRLTPDRSVVLIDVRSTVGPISFGADGLTGSIAADITDGAIRPRSHPSAHVEIAVDGLRSGNRVYDAELLRRIDARRFPTATLDLGRCLAVGSTGRYRVAGELTFHGVTRPTEGTVDIAVAADGRLVVTGEQVFDIRDFAVPSPTVLMLRIYPDVRVHLHVEAKPEVT